MFENLQNRRNAEPDGNWAHSGGGRPQERHEKHTVPHANCGIDTHLQGQQGRAGALPRSNGGDVWNNFFTTPLNDALRSSVFYQFLGRICEEVRRNAGIHFRISWDDVKRTFKERYCSLRSPHQKQVLQILHLRRERREGMTAYARRVADEARQPSVWGRVFPGRSRGENCGIRRAYKRSSYEPVTGASKKGVWGIYPLALSRKP